MSKAQEQADLFDRIMCLPVFRLFEPFYKRHKEALLYLFFGGLSFLVSIGSFALFTQLWNINELISNVLSWILAVLFAYATNRSWVFHSSSRSWLERLRELLSFLGGRVISKYYVFKSKNSKA